MPTIDDKVVAMSFDSSKFESGVNKTISALDKLNASLKKIDGGKSFKDLDAASKQVNLGHIANGVDSIRQKLGFLSVAALAVFANIAQRAVAAGAQLVKSLTIEPLIAGFQEYTTNLNSIQTILGNTKASGADLQDVNSALQELNRYSDKTIYNFSEMARNIGTFTAAGVALKPATAAIKGIANLAALSGSNSQQASTAMYQLSQAIAAGRVSLMDWNSVVNAGMGGTVFQRALAQTAVTMGELPKSALKLVGPMKNVSINGQSFRQSMMAAPGKQSWLTSDVLTKTLAQFTGDMTDAQLAAEGFSKAQIKNIQTQAKMALQAATQVKTFTQVIEVAKETAGSGWAQTWQIILGDFGEAKKTFTAVSNAINGFINANARARNKVLTDWKELGGRTMLIDGIKIAFQNLGRILAPIKAAFRDIFPRKTGFDLLMLTLRFREFAKSLQPSAETIKNIHRTFAGLFAVMDIGKQIIGGILRVFGRLFGILLGGSGSFLEITGSIGDFFVALDKSLKAGKGLATFFDGLTAVLAIPIKLFQKITEAIADMFSGFSPAGFSVQIDGANKAAGAFKKTLEVISQALEGIGPAISNAISDMNFDAILSVINTGLFAAIVLMFRRFIGGTTLERVLGLFGNKLGKGLAKNLGGGVLGKLGGAFQGLTGSLTAMQHSLQAQTLERIAIAIALLTASVVALSFVDPEKINASLSAMALMFGELVGAMMLMNKVMASKGFYKLPIIAASLILLATAIDILTLAVIGMSKLSWSELIKGLGGVAALLLTIIKTAGALSANAAGLVRAGVGIAAIGIGLNILALAVKQLGSMNLADLAKGLGAVALALWVVAKTAQMTPTGMIAQGAGMIALATGIYIMAKAVEKFGSMDLRTIGQGLIGVAGSLIIITRAMKSMPEKDMIRTAIALTIVGVALNIIAKAVQRMGGMSMAEMAKGLIGLGGALWILSKALDKMSLNVKSAGSFAIIAAGLALMAPALVSLGRQSWASVVKGLISLAGGIAIIGLSASILSGSIPALLGFGAAMVLIGGGLALAGAGIALVGIGLSAIAVAGPTAVGIMINALIDLVEAIPRIAENLVLGLLAIVQAFAKTAPQFVAAGVKIIDSLAQALIKSSPKIAEAMVVLIQSMLVALAKHAPQIVQAGFDILINLLKGVRQNITQITILVGEIVVNFLNALAMKLGDIVRAGFNIVTSLIRGVINNIGRVISAAVSAVASFISGIAKSYGKVITAGANVIIRFVTGIVNNVSRIVTAGANAVSHFITGIGNSGAKLIGAATNMIIKLVNALGSNSVKLLDAGANAIIKFLHGVATTIRKREPEMIAAGFDIGKAIIEGMIKGLVAWAPAAYEKAKSIGEKLEDYLKHPWKIFSPSKVAFDIGKNIIMGLVIGLDATSPNVYASASGIANGLIAVFNDTFETASPSKVMKRIGKYVITGFVEGLTGTSDEIKSAFASLKDRLSKEIASLRERITEEKKKLAELKKSPEANAKAIKAEENAIANDEKMLKKLLATQKTLTKEQKVHQKELLKLAKQYDEIGEKISAAKDALAEATQIRDEAAKTLAEDYSQLPDFIQDQEGDKSKLVENYVKSLKNQIEAIKKYKATLDQLRALGLDDTTYKKLLEEGTADQAFAEQLLAAGPEAIKQLNALDADLLDASKDIADTGAKNLYQSGVDIAQGFLDGLVAQQDAIAKQMEKIAEALVAAINRRLGIRSPSKEFAEVGSRAMEGLAKGFTDATQKVTDGVESVADSALAKLRESMRGAGSMMSEELSAKAVITPILDLTQAQDQAKKLGSLLNVAPINAKVSLGQAAAISATQNVSRTDSDKQVAAQETVVKFEQNNYSPEALSEIEIYRQTKNQISQFKSMVFSPA